MAMLLPENIFLGIGGMRMDYINHPIINMLKTLEASEFLWIRNTFRENSKIL